MLASLQPYRDFTSMIRSQGRVAEHRMVSVRERLIDDEIARLLRLSTKSPAIEICSLRLSDGEPAIHCRETVPASLFPLPLCIERITESRSFYESTQAYLAAEFGFSAQTFTLSLHAESVLAELAQTMKTEVGAPVLVLRGVSHGPTGHPLFYNVDTIDTRRFSVRATRSSVAL
jgi:DNA-binding GntR family transcriptional regulator